MLCVKFTVDKSRQHLLCSFDPVDVSWRQQVIRWPQLELRSHFQKQVNWCRNWQGVHDRHNTIRGGFSIFIPGVGYGLGPHWHQNIETLWHHQHHFTRLVSSKNYFTKTMRRLTRAITTPKWDVCCSNWWTNKVKTKLQSWWFLILAEQAWQCQWHWGGQC